MADTKITALTAITTVDPAVDVLPIVDVSDTTMAASGTTKKITSNQILGAGGTATLASATITGDLTVDTSTLYVSSSTDKVGIGTTSLSNEKLTVAGNISANAWLGRSNISAPTGDCSIFRSADNTLGFGIASSTAMTLNSTGLGVGGSPLTKIFANVTPPGAGQDGVRVSDGTRLIQMSISGSTYSYQGIGANQNVIYASGNPLSILSDGQNLRLGTTLNNYLLLDTSGNVGIGVTPSAWWSSTKALQFGLGGSISGRTDTGARSYFASNAFLNSSPAWTYVTTNFATRYEQNDGTHQWHIAPSGTAGNAITFTQAMTLTAGGDLLVGKSSASATTIGFEGRANGTVNSTLASSVDANATYAAYSTGAAAYRFYVGMGGTVYATNTTISAISDARLKENVQDIDVGLGAILALKPRKFDWKEGKGKNIKGDRGFIAQEFEQVFPQLVDEWKDEAPEGEAPYKSVRQDLIPVLVKAIQELAAEVNALKNA